MRDASKRVLRNEHKQERGLEMGGLEMQRLEPQVSSFFYWYVFFLTFLNSSNDYLIL